LNCALTRNLEGAAASPPRMRQLMVVALHGPVVVCLSPDADMDTVATVGEARPMASKVATTTATPGMLLDLPPMMDSPTPNARFA
jgi:hypothetical protein